MLRKRRYEVLESPGDVREDVFKAIGQEVLVHLNIHLADAYEGAEIPADIEDRNVAFNVVSISAAPKKRLRAYGFTPERTAVNVSIPFEETERCTFTLIDNSSR